MSIESLPTTGIPDRERPLLTVVADEAADESLGVDELGSRIVGLAGRVASATCRWLLLVGRFDAQEGFQHFGLPSTARWLSHYCGISVRTASDHVRVARALTAHDRLATEMAAGRLSYSQARAISRAADLGDAPLLENLIMVAEHGTVRQLEEVVRGLRSVDDNQRGIDRHPAEYVAHRWRADSRWGLSARLDPENGALVQSALETVARKEGVNQAQALIRLAEMALATLTATATSTPSLRGDQLAAIQIHVDADAVPAERVEEGPSVAGLSADRIADRIRELAAPDARAGSRSPERTGKHRVQGRGGDGARHHRPRPAARIVGGPGLPDRVLKRLLCAGRIRTVVLDPGRQPLDVGRNNRVVSERVYTALLLRDGGCAYPGCGSRIGLEAHHVRHWIHGGRTVMANLILLCRRHHHAHHDGEFSIQPLGGGQFRFVRRDRRTLPDHANPSRYFPTSAPLEDAHRHVEPTAASGRWDGSRLSLDYAVSALAQDLDSTGGDVTA